MILFLFGFKKTRTGAKTAPRAIGRVLEDKKLKEIVHLLLYFR